jgi:hypothetical protein
MSSLLAGRHESKMTDNLRIRGPSGGTKERNMRSNKVRLSITICLIAQLLSKSSNFANTESPQDLSQFIKLYKKSFHIIIHLDGICSIMKSFFTLSQNF